MMSSNLVNEVNFINEFILHGTSNSADAMSVLNEMEIRIEDELSEKDLFPLHQHTRHKWDDLQAYIQTDQQIKYSKK